MNGLSETFYSLTALLSVLAVVLNGPMQIQMNASQRQCGQPIFVVCLSLALVLSRFIHLCLEKKWKLAISDGIGAIVCVVLIGQHWYFHW